MLITGKCLVAAAHVFDEFVDRKFVCDFVCSFVSLWE